MDANQNSTITAVDVAEEHKSLASLAPAIDDHADKAENLLMHLLGSGRSNEEMKIFAKTLVESLKQEIRE